ncbi:MAG: putative glycosyltransferase [Acidimicrobiia bacterium]|nr:putative glycosyltransferase [Acidimicrobiia bacterium]
MPVRVAFDTTPLVGAPTGVGEFVGLAAAALSERPDCQLVRYVLSMRAPRPGPQVRWLRYPASLAVRAWRFSDVPNARRSLHGVDVVHGTNYVAPPTGLPTVLTIHDCSFVTRPEGCRAVVRAFAPVARRQIERGAWVHTPSQYVAAEVRQYFKTDRIAVIAHGAPDVGALPPPARDASKPMVLSIATLEPRKNLARLVEAFGLVHQQLPQARLVLAGGAGKDLERVTSAISALDPKAAAQVTLTGWVNHQQRYQLLAEASVLAYPSLDEGFGLPLLEAMACAVPVVASNAGAIPEVAADAALLVDPSDSEALAKSLLVALTDDGARAGLIERGAARVAEYSWARTAEQLVGLYEKAVAEQ